MLSYNVAGLLRSAPGASRRYPVAVDALPIADDLHLAGPIEGEVQLSRTGRSIIARVRFHTQVAEQCSRCLVPVRAPITVEIEEEALPSVDISSGAPVSPAPEPETLRLNGRHELDLTGVVRDAISLAEPITSLCRQDCRGLCLVCGADLNQDPAHGHPEEAVDPRFAGLAALRERLEA